MPAMCNLELFSEPYEEVLDGFKVIVCPVRLNVNLKTNLKDELEAKRKVQLTANIFYSIQEVKRDLHEAVHELALADSSSSKSAGDGRLIADYILRQCREMHRHFQGLPAEWYNNDANYISTSQRIASLQPRALNMFSYWRHNLGVGLWNIGALSMSHVSRVDWALALECFRQHVAAADDGGEEGAERGLGTEGEDGMGTGGDGGGEMESGVLNVRAHWSRRLFQRPSSHDILQEISSRKRTLADVALGVLELEGLTRANINAPQGAERETPLILAAVQGDVDRVQLLVTAGCVVYRAPRCSKGYSALAAACMTGQDACVRCLLEARADVEEANDRGETPLFVACRFGWAKCVRLLLLHCLPEAKSCDGWTCLHSAAGNGRTDVVELLCQHPRCARLLVSYVLKSLFYRDFA